MSNPVNVPDWWWERADRDTRIRWVMLGHTLSPAPGEMDRYTAVQWQAAAAIVDAYDRGTAPPPVRVPDPPPPPAPVPLQRGIPCPTCGGQYPR